MIDEEPDGKVGQVSEKTVLGNRKEGIVVPSNVSYAAKASLLKDEDYNLGAMYECGYETDSSLKVALDYYKEATQEGHPNALAAKSIHPKSFLHTSSGCFECIYFKNDR